MKETTEALLSLRFLGDTKELLKKKWQHADPVHYPLTRRASIKDIIEALGIPHTEAGRIETEAGQEVDFSYLPECEETLSIHPISAGLPVTCKSMLHPQPLQDIKFLADINVGKLARLLRMAGINTATVTGGPITEIADQAVKSSRIMLSTNRDLLKQSRIVFGRLVRSAHPISQFRDIRDTFNLVPLFKPFSRCMKCNGPLNPVDKKKIVHRLKPLTIKYYSTFKQCESCSSLYWPGSHHEKMSAELRGPLLG